MAALGVGPRRRRRSAGADVVVTATSSREPVLGATGSRPGAHVNAVGASMPSARELDVETVAASALFCDSRESLRNEAGEFQLAVEEGAIAGEDHVRAELGEVLAGTAPGRRSDERADAVPLARARGRGPRRGAVRGRSGRAGLGIGTEVEL